MPLAEHEYTVGEYNGAWRSGFGRTLSGADKHALAVEFGVSDRTVQRWTTTAGEQRNPIPSRLEGVPEDEWPEVYRARADLTRRAGFGGENEETDTASEAEFGEVRGSLPDANRFARDLEREVLDPWLTEAWRAYRLVKTDRGWEVRVTYDTTVSPGVGRAAA